MNRTLVILSILVWTPAFGLSTQDIDLVATQIYQRDCQKELLPEELIRCNSLSQKISLLREADFKHKLDEQTKSMTGDWTRNLEPLIDTWTVAAEKLGTYSPDSVLPFVLCIENGMSTWLGECKLYHEIYGDSEFSLMPGLHKCSVTRESKAVQVEINMLPDCNNPYLRIGIRTLGKGEFKKAFRMFNYSDWTELAYLRFLKRYEERNDASKKQMEEEIRLLNILKEVNQPGIPKLFYADRRRILMERFEGELGPAIGPIVLGKNRWKQVALQLGSGLAYLHSLGYILNDIKPPNILVTSGKPTSGDTRAVFTDFGLAVDVRTLCREKGIKIKRYVKGTIAYMPPETLQKLSGNYSWVGEECAEVEYNAQLEDMFSLGIVIWKAKTGKDLPWHAEKCFASVEGYVGCMNEELPKFLVELQKSADPVDHLLGKSIESDWGNRLSSKEFTRQLKQLIKIEPLDLNRSPKKARSKK